MKKRHSIQILLAVAAIFFAATACTQDGLTDDTRLPEGQYPLQIAAVTLSVEGGEAQPWGAPQTRVSEIADGNSSKFDADDKFAVQIDGKDEVGTYAVQDNNTVKAKTPLYWSDTGEHTVTAWYPATGGTLDLSDQSQSLAYLLYGTGSGNYQTQVTLNFTHALAKVRVTPTDDALGEVQSLQLYTYTQCTYEKGTVVQGSQEGWIEMKKCEYTENGATITCWEANVVPGYEITKLMANNDNKERDLSAAITPEAGKFYNITLDKDKGYTDDGQGNYTVTSAEGLKNIAKLVNEEGQTDIDITLTGNITLTGDWTPIGDNNNQYTGTFDGGDHTITGLTVTTSDQYAGLFGYIGSGGKVKDVTLKDVKIESNNGMGYVGGVAGWSYGNIENCSVSGSVSGSGNNGTAGGVVGFQVGGSLTGCSSSATVKGVTYAGGIAGSTNSGATLTACYATGDVTLESINQYYNFAGGVVGSNSSSSTLKACYAWGSVSGIGIGTIYTGGVTGTNDVGTLTACYHAKGTVKGSDGATGGVAGRNFKDSMLGSGIITACYWGDNGQEQGIGEDQVGTGGTTKVVDGNWTDAMKVMNEKLSGTGWLYVPGSGDAPLTLRKQ